jgi:hypothetical protein
VTSSSATISGSVAASSSAASAYGYASTSAHTPWWASEPQRASISSFDAGVTGAPVQPSSAAQIR